MALDAARISGGWLEAWGEPGRGSVFRLTLPRTVGAELAGSPLPLAPDGAEVAETAATRRLAGGHGTIRVTDENPALRLAHASGAIPRRANYAAARPAGP